MDQGQEQASGQLTMDVNVLPLLKETDVVDTVAATAPGANAEDGIMQTPPQPSLPPPPLPPSSQAALYSNWNSYSDSEPDRAIWREGEALQDLSNGAAAAVGGAGDVPLKRSIDMDSQDESDDAMSAKKKQRNTDDRAERFAKGKDYYCWCCHKEKANVSCLHCPRAYHYKCLTANNMIDKADSNSKDLNRTYVCYNCKVEKAPHQVISRALKSLSSEELNDLLIHALDAIRVTADPTFHHPVLSAVVPDYRQFVINPMDLETIEAKAKKRQYRYVDEFLADINWIVHNCYIYNSHNHPLTTNAKQFYKLASSKIVDLEICPDCFKNFHVKPDFWFTEACRKPHVLVWAKLTGHPFWPGKVVRLNPNKKEADVRFFGAHDRAWVAVDQCFIITENNSKAKAKGPRSKFDGAIKELCEHVKKIETKLGKPFPYAEPRTLLNPKRLFMPVDGQEEEEEDEEEEVKEEEVAPNDDDDVESQLVIADAGSATPKRKATAERSLAKIGTATKTNTDSDSKSTTPSQSPPHTEAKKQKKNDSSNSKGLSIGTPFRKGSDSDSASDGKSSLKLKKDNNELDQRKPSAGPTTTPQQPPRVSTPNDTKGRSLKSTPVIDTSASTSKSSAKSSRRPISPPMKRDAPYVLQPGPADELQALKCEFEKLKNSYDKLSQEFSTERAAKKLEFEATYEKLKRDFDKEKDAELSEAKRAMDAKHREVLNQIKKKQWCAHCAKEAIYYCCWNTSYCSYDCQTAHWSDHMSTCQQQRQTQHQQSKVGRGNGDR